MCWRTPFLCAALLCAGLLGAGGASGGNDAALRLDQLPQQWRDDRGAPLALTKLLGQRVVVAMAYTHCRTICPATIAELKRMQRTLDERGMRLSSAIVAGQMVRQWE